MHATTSASCIVAIDAGRQALPALPAISHTTPDLSSAQPANDNVPQLPVKTPIREQHSEARPKLANARRSTMKKVTWLMNLIIPIFRKPRTANTEMCSPPNGSQDYLAELKDAHQAACLVALQDENNKALLPSKPPSCLTARLNNSIKFFLLVPSNTLAKR